MNNYSIFKKDKQTEVVKNGWSWPAFFLGGLWAIFMAPDLFWIIVGLNVGTRYFRSVIGGSEFVNNNILYIQIFMTLLLHIFYGKVGNEFRGTRLTSKGFSFITNVEAIDQEDALRAYEKKRCEWQQEQEARSKEEEQTVFAIDEESNMLTEIGGEYGK